MQRQTHRRYRIAGRCAIVLTLASIAAVSLGGADATTSTPEPESVEPVEPIVVRFGVLDPPVVAQRDITVDGPPAPRATVGLPLECSGIAYIGGRLIMTSDRHQHALFVCPVDTESMRIGLPEHVPVIRNQQNLLDDAEAIAVLPSANGGAMAFAYAMCSLSNDKDAVPLPQRRHMLWFVFDPDADPLRPRRTRVIDAGPLREQINTHFQKLHVDVYRTYNKDADRNTYRWGNIEGIAITPRSTTSDAPTIDMLLGMRNPLIHEQAIVVAASIPRELSGGELKVTDLFVLDLGGRGIADLCWDPVTRGYLIVGARSNGPKLGPDQPFPPNTLGAALFWWSGRKTEKPIRFADVPDMKIESVCRLGDKPYIAFVSDEGDVSEGRTQRQSVLTIMHFTGVGDLRGGAR